MLETNIFLKELVPTSRCIKILKIRKNQDSITVLVLIGRGYHVIISVHYFDHCPIEETGRQPLINELVIVTKVKDRHNLPQAFYFRV